MHFKHCWNLCERSFSMRIGWVSKGFVNGRWLFWLETGKLRLLLQTNNTVFKRLCINQMLMHELRELRKIVYKVYQ